VVVATNAAAFLPAPPHYPQQNKQKRLPSTTKDYPKNVLPSKNVYPQQTITPLKTSTLFKKPFLFSIIRLV
jgi:hypothetical protein